MSQNLALIAMFVIVVTALVSGAVVLSSMVLREDRGRTAEPELGAEGWQNATAEVVSILRAGNRTFLQVRYRAGRSLISNDVLYPAQTPVPVVGQRVAIRYDPAAPARAVYDRQRIAGRAPRVTEPDGPPGPVGPVARGPLTAA